MGPTIWYPITSLTIRRCSAVRGCSCISVFVTGKTNVGVLEDNAHNKDVYVSSKYESEPPIEGTEAGLTYDKIFTDSVMSSPVFLFLFSFYCKCCPWVLFLIGSSAYLKHLLIVWALPGALHCSWMSHGGCTALAGVARAQHDTLQCRKKAIQWNIMEGTKQGQTAIWLVYKMSPHCCMFPRFNITLSSGLYCQKPWGSS